MWKLSQSLAPVSLVCAISCTLNNCVLGDQPTSPAPEEVISALQREAHGQPVDRLAVVGSSPQNDWLGWQAGLIKTGQAWKHLESFDENGLDEAYLAKRAECGTDLVGQLKLAHWCLENRREQQARAHFFAVVAIDPDHADARRRLGHVKLGDQWVDERKLKLEREAMLQRIESLKEWSTKLRPILSDLSGPTNKRTILALDRLDAIETDAALPALLVAALNADDDLAHLLVKKISQSHSREACLGLVSVATGHPSVVIRLQAIDSLRPYPLEMFVPTLLNNIASDTTVHNQLVYHPDGRVSLEAVVTQELKDKHVQQAFQKSVNVLSSFSARKEVVHQIVDFGEAHVWSIMFRIPKENAVPKGRTHEIVSEARSTAVENAIYVPPEILQAVTDNLKERGRQTELAVEQKNRAGKIRAAAIYNLLRRTTHQSFEDDPVAWWNWWSDYNERYRAGLKPVQKSYSASNEKLALDSRLYGRTFAGVSYRPVEKVLVQHSCLIAGTTVQTSTGPKAIESIEIGDLVAAQDVESGEVALRPVLLTTIRPPKTTWKIVTSGATIQATGGHAWWTSGKGWTKTRDLEPGSYLHTATGNVLIKELIEDPEPVPTYNLIVDQAHTYFVGPDRVLSHDNSPESGTTLKLPGYVEP